MKQNLLFVFSILIGSVCLQAQTTVNITADRDNTLYESTTGSLSNGAGIHLFFGKTNNGGLRRALLHFDLSTLPTGAVISSATLNFQVNKVKSGSGPDTANIHLVNSNWGEGTSNAGTSNDGNGTNAATGDATWVHTFFNTSNWSTAGGDFAGRPSATTVVSTTGAYTFSSSQLALDVQGWANGTVSNNGWVILGNESTNGSAKRMVSKENATSTQRPILTVTYNLTGITEAVESTKIGIYPSPADEYLVVEHRRNMFTNDVWIYDNNGKLVMEDKLGPSNRINIQRLESGIYFLELRTTEGNEKVTKKFMKN